MLFGGKRNWGETRISTNALEDWDVAEVGCVHAPARSACQENQSETVSALLSTAGVAADSKTQLQTFASRICFFLWYNFFKPKFLPNVECTWDVLLLICLLLL